MSHMNDKNQIGHTELQHDGKRSQSDVFAAQIPILYPMDQTACQVLSFITQNY